MMSMALLKKLVRTYLVANGVIVTETVLESICYKLIEEGNLKDFAVNHVNDDLYRRFQELKLSMATFSFKDIKRPFRKNKEKGEC